MRVRWHVSANLLGIVLSRDESIITQCLIVWTTGDTGTRIAWHLEDALMRVDDESVSAVRERCNPGL